MLSLSRLRCYSNITDEFELRIQSGCQTTDQLTHDRKKVPQLAASKGGSKDSSDKSEVSKENSSALAFLQECSELLRQVGLPP